jgi:hypothetical protein
MKRAIQLLRKSRKPYLLKQKINEMLFPIIVISCFIVQSFLPWWTIAPVCFLCAYFFSTSMKQAFGLGFCGVFILWFAKILSLSIPNEHLLANKIGQVFTLPESPYKWLIILLFSCTIGGLTGGISSLCGSIFRKKG